MGILRKLLGLGKKNQGDMQKGQQSPKNAQSSVSAAEKKEEAEYPIFTPFISDKVPGYLEVTTRQETCDELKKRFIAFDVETTGVHSYNDRIIEYGAVLFENGTPVRTFQTLVNPGVSIPAAASKVNGITDEMLNGAPSEKKALARLFEFFGSDTMNGSTIICAHNAIFDMDFLMATIRRNGLTCNMRCIDTLQLSRKYLKLDSYSQTSVAQSMGIEIKDAHRAYIDALVCGNVMKNLIDYMEKDIKRQQAREEKRLLTDEELEICGTILDDINRLGGDTEKVNLYKNANLCVDMCWGRHTAIKFKVGKKGKYIVLPSDISVPESLDVQPCTENEGGNLNKRVWFRNPEELKPLTTYFNDALISAKAYTESGRWEQSDEKKIIRFVQLTKEEAEELAQKASERNYEPPKPAKKKLTDEEKAKRKQERDEERARKAEEKRLKKEAERAKDPPKTNKRAIMQLDDEGRLISEYQSLSDASKAAGISTKCIRDCAIGKQKHAGGFVWKYKEDSLIPTGKPVGLQVKMQSLVSSLSATKQL